jgi:hypothetical protein
MISTVYTGSRLIMQWRRKKRSGLVKRHSNEIEDIRVYRK